MQSKASHKGITRNIAAYGIRICQLGVIFVLLSSLFFMSPYFVPVPSTRSLPNNSALFPLAFADLRENATSVLVQTNQTIDTGAAHDESNSFSRTGRISVTNFGAIPDDGLDDTDGFRKAVEAVAGSSAFLFLPAGTYNVNDTISLASGLVIEGEGRDVAIIKWSIKNSTHGVMTATGEPEAPIKYITLRNFWINGTGPNTMGNCIRLVNTIDFRIENTRLTNCGGDPNGGAIYTRTSAYGTIIHNVIDNSRNGYITPAYYLVKPEAGNDDFFGWNDTPTDNQTAEFRAAGSNNILIAYNQITNSEDDAIHPQNGYDNKIIGNTAIDSGDDNIDTFREKNTIIENNTIIMNKQSVHVNGFEIGDGSENIILRKNKVIGGAAFGINVATDPGFLVKKNANSGLNRNITITDNEVSDSTLGCLRTFYSEYVLVANNTFNRCNTISIFEEAPDTQTSLNNTSSEPDDVRAIDAEQRLSRSQGGYSILLAASSDNVTITNNLIEYIGGKKTSAGIYLRDPDFVNINNNRIQVAGEDSLWNGDGIYIAENIDNVNIDHNDLSACGCGIEIASSKQNIHVSVLESTTTIQAVRVPFSFVVTDSTPRSNDTAQYSVSGSSVIRVNSVEIYAQEHRLMLQLDRGPDKVSLAGTLDIVIPKQIMDTITNVKAFSNRTASHEDNSTGISPGTVQQGSIVFVEHQKEQKLPFQVLSEGINSTSVRVSISEIVDSLEVTGSSTTDEDVSSGPRLGSLNVRQTGLIISVVTILAGLGSVILFFEKRSHAPK